MLKVNDRICWQGGKQAARRANAFPFCAAIWLPSYFQRIGRGFLSCRRWRESEYRSDMARFSVAKREMRQDWAEAMALDVVRVLEQLGLAVGSVIAAPRSHESDFAGMVAGLVAESLGVSYTPDYFAPRLRGGKHHSPRTNLDKSPVSITASIPLPGPVLLFDDVTTSGQTMQESIGAAIEAGQSVVGLVWCGRFTAE